MSIPSMTESPDGNSPLPGQIPAQQPGMQPAKLAGAEHLRGASDAADDEVTAALRVRLAPLLPDYNIGARVGRGGMGIVFAAKQARLERDVAIKVLVAPDEHRAAWTERFLREAKALARLSHTGIVSIYDFGEREGVAWIVMELVDGSNLRELIREGALPPEEALAIAPEICRALSYAHANGVVHRDIKPENVLIQADGSVKLVDFGLAKLSSTDGDEIALTRPTQAMGTVRYMAPEQLEAPLTVDHRADIFSAGVVLYEMLTGHVPQGIVDPPSKTAAVDPHVDQAVFRALEREPGRRFQRAEDMESGLTGENQDDVASPSASATASDEFALEPTDAEALSETRVNTSIDAAVALLSIVAAGFGVPIAMQFMQFGIDQIILCAVVVAILNLPGIVRAIKRTTAVPFVRFFCGIGAIAVTIAWAMSEAKSGNMTSHGDSLFLAFTLLGVLQFVAASISRVAPHGFLWGEDARTNFHIGGIFIALLAAASAVASWQGGSRSALQWTFLVGAIVFAADLARRTAQRSEDRIAKARSLGHALFGLLGFFVVALANLPHGNQACLPAMVTTLSLAALGGLEGAGTPLLGRRSAR